MKFFVFGPVLWSIGIPIDSKLINFKHRERLLLLLLFVNVNENPFKVIVCRRVVQGIKHDSKIELAVNSAHAVVLKSYMKISNTHPYVLFNYATEATHVRLFISDFLSFFTFLDILG
jgi:hypothetical protein